MALWRMQAMPCLGKASIPQGGRTLLFHLVSNIFILIDCSFSGVCFEMDTVKVLFTNRYTLSYAVAVLLHLLFFTVYVPLAKILIRPRTVLPSRQETPPLTFEFVEVPNQRSSERPPKESPLLSDRQSVAQDWQEAWMEPSYLPYSEGLVESREHLRTAVGRDGERGANGEGTEGEASVEASEQQALMFREQDVDFVSLLKEGPMQTREQRREAVYGTPAIPPALKLDNQRSSALEDGALQLSTYKWDFAPYVAYLKRRIGNHVFPPAAFTELGLIEGRTLLRFKILRDGRLKDLEVMNYDGSDLLRNTSYHAVVLSAPFLPLPDDFPDAFLEITGLFNYTLIRDADRSR